jgi:hypothetical protein
MRFEISKITYLLSALLNIGHFLLFNFLFLILRLQIAGPSLEMHQMGEFVHQQFIEQAFRVVSALVDLLGEGKNLDEYGLISNF